MNTTHLRSDTYESIMIHRSPELNFVAQGSENYTFTLSLISSFDFRAPPIELHQSCSNVASHKSNMVSFALSFEAKSAFL